MSSVCLSASPLPPTSSLRGRGQPYSIARLRLPPSISSTNNNNNHNRILQTDPLCDFCIHTLSQHSVNSSSRTTAAMASEVSLCLPPVLPRHPALSGWTAGAHGSQYPWTASPRPSCPDSPESLSLLLLQIADSFSPLQRERYEFTARAPACTLCDNSPPPTTPLADSQLSIQPTHPRASG